LLQYSAVNAIIHSSATNDAGTGLGRYVDCRGGAGSGFNAASARACSPAIRCSVCSPDRGSLLTPLGKLVYRRALHRLAQTTAARALGGSGGDEGSACGEYTPEVVVVGNGKPCWSLYDVCADAVAEPVNARRRGDVSDGLRVYYLWALKTVSHTPAFPTADPSPTPRAHAAHSCPQPAVNSDVGRRPCDCERLRSGAGLGRKACYLCAG